MSTRPDPTKRPVRRVNPREDFEQMFIRYYERAVRLARMIGARDDAHARDVATDAMARVWEQWRRGTVDDFWPYLRVAVVNEIRSRARRQRVVDRYNETLIAGIPMLKAEPVMADRETLEKALARLGARQRTCLVLRYFEDLTNEQTAKVMRCSVGTVKSTTSRALTALRAMLEEHDDA